MLLGSSNYDIRNSSKIIDNILYENIQNLSLNEGGPIAVVVLDDLHENDYSDGSLDNAFDDLELNGFITKYASDFSSWETAVNSSDILVMSAPYGDLSTSDIISVKKWFESGSRNLLIASRGDFEDVNFNGINNLLKALNSSMKVQDDNVYTTNQAARQDWYVDSSNFNKEAFPELFDNTVVVNFFSPSSLSDSDVPEVLIYAEKEAYQTNQNGNPAEIIYDDTEDGLEGEKIPLSLYEELDFGDEKDRIVTIGTTMWSDFDYGDPDNDDPIFFMNLMNYFVEKTLEIEEIIIDLPDESPPRLKIDFPHNNAKLKGTVNLTLAAFDLFGVSSYSIKIGGKEVSTNSFYVWDTTKEEKGKVEVVAIASDEAGNVATVTQNYVIDQDFVPVINKNSKFLEYNIKQSGAFSQWLDVLKEENADVAVLVETGDFDNNDDKLLKKVTEELNSYFFDEINYESATMQNIPDNYDGITILSRFPIKSSTQLKSLIDDEGGNVGVALPFFHSILLIGEIELNVIGAHLTAGTSAEDKVKRESEQESILNYMDDLGDFPIVYLGDMNSEAKRDNSQSNLGNEPIEMLVNPNNEHASEVHTFVDVYAKLNPNGYKPSYLTFPSRIDFIFVNQWMSNLISDSTIGGTFSGLAGSDHVSVDVFIDLNKLTEYEPQSSKSGPLDLNLSYFVLISYTIIVSINRKRNTRISHSN